MRLFLQDLDIHENEKEKAIKLYDDVLKKIKIEIAGTEDSLQRMSALTTKYVFVIDQVSFANTVSCLIMQTWKQVSTVTFVHKVLLLLYSL